MRGLRSSQRNTSSLVPGPSPIHTKGWTRRSVRDGRAQPRGLSDQGFGGVGLDGDPHWQGIGRGFGGRFRSGLRGRFRSRLGSGFRSRFRSGLGSGFGSRFRSGFRSRLRGGLRSRCRGRLRRGCCRRLRRWGWGIGVRPLRDGQVGREQGRRQYEEQGDDCRARDCHSRTDHVDYRLLRNVLVLEGRRYTAKRRTRGMERLETPDNAEVSCAWLEFLVRVRGESRPHWNDAVGPGPSRAGPLQGHSAICCHPLRAPASSNYCVAHCMSEHHLIVNSND